MSKAPDNLLMRYLDARFDALHAKLDEVKQVAEVGVSAKEEVSTLKTQLSTIWTVIVSIPVVGGVLVYLGWIGPAEAGNAISQSTIAK